MNRREFLIGATALSSCFALPSICRAEAGWLEVTHREVPLGLPAGQSVKILHLADLHHSTPETLSVVKESIELGLAERPDLALLTGDYIDAFITDSKALAAALASLAARVPTFASLGNHDGGKWGGGYKSTKPVRQLLERAGVEVLHNRSVIRRVRGTAVRVVGVGDQWSGEFDPKVAFGGSIVSDSVPTILLSHNPDSKDELRSYPWNLMLCGHTHGGQAKIPILGLVPIVPIKDLGYISGLNAWGKRWIHTTRGVGSVFGMRFNCRPEVSILTATA